MFFQVRVADLPLERLPQVAFAENQEPRVGHVLDDERRGVDEMPLAFMRHEGRDVADDRRAVREPERLVDVHRRRRVDQLEVDPFVHGHGSI